MPDLGVTVDEIPTLTAFTLRHIGSVMLYPQDSAKRELAQHAFNADEAVRLMQMLPSDLPKGDTVVDFGEQGEADFFKWLAYSPRVSDIVRENEIQSQFFHGCIMGNITIRLINANKKGASLTLKDLKKELAMPSMYLSESTIDNTIIRNFRSVAHLWASYNEGFRQAPEYYRSIPCHRDALLTFLARAESIRDMGEQVKLTSRIGSLIDPDNVWRLSPDVRRELGF